MTDYTDSSKDRDIFSSVAAGKFDVESNRKMVANGYCDGWTEETLQEYYAPKKISVFFENLPGFEKKGATFDCSRVAVVKLSNCLNLYYKSGSVWTTSEDVLDQIIYEQTHTVEKCKRDFLEYAKFDEDANALRLDDMNVRYLPVGSKFFDSETGELLDEAPYEELRIFGINRNVDYHPTTVADCDGYLMSTLRAALGDGALEYILRCVGHNLHRLNLTARHLLIIVGKSRSGKGTVLRALSKIGLTDDRRSITPDLEHATQYKELSSSVLPVYPVACANELTKMDWAYGKQILSDDYISVDRKLKQTLSFPVRAFVIATANRMNVSSEAGLRNKITILRTKASYRQEENPNYWEDVEADGYDEFINCILTYSLDKEWNPSMLPESIKEESEQLTNQYIYLDSYLDSWDMDAADIHLEEAYRRMLKFANPDSWTDLYLDNAVNWAKNHGGKANPEGYTGIAYNNLGNILRNISVRVYRGKDGKVWVTGAPTDPEPILEEVSGN